MYAQTNYPQKQGIAPQRYTIAQIGCFITSFANIMERFGVKVSPLGINTLLVSKGLYIDVDDGVRDDVGWTTIISLYPKNIRLESIGNGKPTSNNSIVKFNYRSTVTGSFTTHFCLVQDAKAGTIIDSWDGKVKSWTVYGGPVSYATYSKLTSAVPVTPQGGVEMFNTEAEVQEAYLLLRGVKGTSSETKSWIGQPKQRFFQVGLKEADSYRAERDALRKQLADVQKALANEKAKPPKEVVKVVEKIVEKPVEVPTGGVDAETKAEISAIRAGVDWIKALLTKVFKG